MGLRVRLGLVHCTSNYDKQLTIVGQAQRTSFIASELSHLVGARSQLDFVTPSPATFVVASPL